jgi:hypothetical protein
MNKQESVKQSVKMSNRCEAALNPEKELYDKKTL